MLQELPLADSRWAIHLQKPDADPAPCGSGNDFSIANLEVFIPEISAWMKQRREASGFGIYFVFRQRESFRKKTILTETGSP